MEARKMEIDTRLADRLTAIRDQAAATGTGATLASIAAAAGMNRSTVSQIANQVRIATAEQASRLWGVLNQMNLADGDEHEPDQDAGDLPATPQPPTREDAPAGYKRTVELYPTAMYKKAYGFCDLMREKRKMGVMIGHPGSGKTTVLKEFVRNTPGAHYIECWPMMRMSDLLNELALAAGIALPDTITVYQRTRRVLAALKERDDIVLVFDEAEQLREDKQGVKKYELIRKIWDNTGTPVVFAGTTGLRNLLTRGGGHDNLAQLYRRKYEIEMLGITDKEVRAILRDYNVTADAAAELTKIATDTRHGGMGNFFELLGLCLDAADGARIDASTLTGAMRYKLMY